MSPGENGPMHRLSVAVLAGALAAGLLAACSERRADPVASPPVVASAAATGSAAASATPAPAAGNALVGYLRGAEVQAETDGQRATLRQALHDLQTLPAAELRAARYAAADGRAAQRDLVQVLRAHVVPPAPQAIEIEQLLQDRETDAGRAALRETLATLDRPAPR